MTTSQAAAAGLLAVGAAFVAGLLGAGGDILYVPLLLYVLPVIAGGRLDVHTVTGLSLVQSLASTGAGGASHYRARRVDRAILRYAAPMLALGALVSGLLSSDVSSAAVLLVFATVTTVAAAILAARSPRSPVPDARPSIAVTSGLLLATGLLAGAAGVGAGFLIVTILLHRLDVGGHTAQATGLALSVCTAAPALAGKALTGQVLASPIPFIVGGAIVGSLLGARVSPLLPATPARLALAALVVVLSARVWLDVATGAS